jgi:peptidoglycan/LPS O-acetylase OafA/YrhL
LAELAENVQQYECHSAAIDHGNCESQIALSSADTRVHAPGVRCRSGVSRAPSLSQRLPAVAKKGAQCEHDTLHRRGGPPRHTRPRMTRAVARIAANGPSCARLANHRDPDSLARRVHAKAKLMTSEPGRIRSLDGLRAVAISLVLLAHLPHSLGTTLPWTRYLTPLGTLGVRVFFVISGFLISSLLFAEFSKTANISLKKFYFRRTLRIFPAFYAYVAAIALAASAGLVVLERHDLLAALTYTTNYHRQRSWYLGHAWSLSVEEQFYLLWPFTIKRLGVRRALGVAAAIVIVSPLVRVGTSLLWPAARSGIDETFLTVADAMAVGCLLAGFRARLLAEPRYVALLGSRWIWLLPLLVLAVHLVPYSLVSWFAGETIENVGIALMIHALIDVREGFAVRVLNLAPVAFIGTLSYSIYLWQQPFMRLRPELRVTYFPLSIVALFAAALASYYLVERPMLRLRQRLERRPRRAVEPTVAVTTPPGG